MEKTLERAEDKIKKICDALKNETLEPAKQEAAKIIHDAEMKAEQILKEAHHQYEKRLHEAKAEIERERKVFYSSLEQAGKQALEELRQTIEHSFFSDELQHLVHIQAAEPRLIAKIIEAIVSAVEKEGLSADLSALVPQSVPAQEVNRLLGEAILAKLKEKSVEIGDFRGGARVKLHNKNMTLDLTDRALEELIARYVRKDFRKLMFKN